MERERNKREEGWGRERNRLKERMSGGNGMV